MVKLILSLSLWFIIVLYQTQEAIVESDREERVLVVEENEVIVYHENNIYRFYQHKQE
jgi:hypothetical protein